MLLKQTLLCIKYSISMTQNSRIFKQNVIQLHYICKHDICTENQTLNVCMNTPVILEQSVTYSVSLRTIHDHIIKNNLRLNSINFNNFKSLSTSWHKNLLAISLLVYCFHEGFIRLFCIELKFKLQIRLLTYAHIIIQINQRWQKTLPPPN